MSLKLQTAASATRAVLELRLSELSQLFNSMDPAPFRERDLDPNAEAYIVDWAREVRAGGPLGLRVQLERQSATAADLGFVHEAVDEHFRRCAKVTRRQLRRLLRTGRISLLIGLSFLAVAIVVGELIAGMLPKESYGWIVKESFVIGGWVALWRPLEIFLYGWWPIRAEARLYDRLGEMEVSVSGVAAPAA